MNAVDLTVRWCCRSTCRRSGHWLLAAVFSAGLVSLNLVSTTTLADDKPAAAAEVAESSVVDDVEIGFPAEQQDAAFDKFVDLSKLANSVGRCDSNELVDMALQLAEGERVLLRPHRLVSSSQVFDLAIRAAAGGKDDLALARLERHAKESKKDDLLVRVTSARQLAAAARAAPLTISIDVNADLAGIVAFQQFRREIEQATMLGDRPRLDLLTEGLDVGDDMPESLRKILNDTLKEARQNLPNEEQTEALRLLAAISRGAGGSGDDDNPAIIPKELARVSGLSGYNQAIWNFCNRNFLSRVGDGQCAALNDKAIEFATGRSFSASGSPLKDDYVWGTRVCTITSGNYAAMSRVASGDLLQFRNVKLSGSYKVGNSTYTYSKSAAHHSAVVMGRLGDGTMLHVFHENSGGKLYVTHGLYRIRDLKQGTIWAYRAK